MDSNILFSPIPLDQLSGLLTSIIRQEIRIKTEEDLHEKFLSPEETCKLFKPAISKPTLESYAEKGLLQKHYLGGRTWFKYSEVIAALKTLKRYQRTPHLSDQSA